MHFMLLYLLGWALLHGFCVQRSHFLPWLQVWSSTLTFSQAWDIRGTEMQTRCTRATLEPLKRQHNNKGFSFNSCLHPTHHALHAHLRDYLACLRLTGNSREYRTN